MNEPPWGALAELRRPTADDAPSSRRTWGGPLGTSCRGTLADWRAELARPPPDGQSRRARAAPGGQEERRARERSRGRRRYSQARRGWIRMHDGGGSRGRQRRRMWARTEDCGGGSVWGTKRLLLQRPTTPDLVSLAGGGMHCAADFGRLGTKGRWATHAGTFSFFGLAVGQR
jgi:hypothetical protein